MSSAVNVKVFNHQCPSIFSPQPQILIVLLLTLNGRRDVSSFSCLSVFVMLFVWSSCCLYHLHVKPLVCSVWLWDSEEGRSVLQTLLKHILDAGKFGFRPFTELNQFTFAIQIWTCPEACKLLWQRSMFLVKCSVRLFETLKSGWCPQVCLCFMCCSALLFKLKHRKLFTLVYNANRKFCPRRVETLPETGCAAGEEKVFKKKGFTS